MTTDHLSPAEEKRIEANLARLRHTAAEYGARLLVVSKNRSEAELRAVYRAGQRAFGENKAQALEQRRALLPPDVEWHMIGHLQTNKVKHIAPFVSLIHSVDSPRLFHEINRQGEKIARVIPCLFQIGIAQEESKFGMIEAEAEDLLRTMASYRFVAVRGLMGMATFTDDQKQIRRELSRLKAFYDLLRQRRYAGGVSIDELSMGMSADYAIALSLGSTLVRIGTAVFQ